MKTILLLVLLICGCTTTNDKGEWTHRFHNNTRHSIKLAVYISDDPFNPNFDPFESSIVSKGEHTLINTPRTRTGYRSVTFVTRYLSEDCLNNMCMCGFGSNED